jgi:hypothetical protein
MTTAALFLFTGAAAAQTYSAIINGAQEAPTPVATPATGSGSFTLDGSKVLSYNISFSGLLASESVAHIHGPAPAGMAASPIFGLPLGSPKIGTAGPLTPQQEADLNAGLWYVNIHSTMFPNGEIRGQILPTVSLEESTWGKVKALYSR